MNYISILSHFAISSRPILRFCDVFRLLPMIRIFNPRIWLFCRNRSRRRIYECRPPWPEAPVFFAVTNPAGLPDPDVNLSKSCAIDALRQRYREKAEPRETDLPGQVYAILSTLLICRSFDPASSVSQSSVPSRTLARKCAVKFTSPYTRQSPQAAVKLDTA